jgi:hypothetical protein
MLVSSLSQYSEGLCSSTSRLNTSMGFISGGTSGAGMATGFPGAVDGGTFFSTMERLAPQLEPVLQAAIAQRASIAVPTAQVKPTVQGSSLSAVGAPGDVTMGFTQSPRTNEAQQDHQIGLYPSEPTRLAFCLRVLQVWRNDPVAQHVRAWTDSLRGSTVLTQPGGNFLDANPFASPFAAPMASLGMAAPVRQGTEALAQILTQARSRAGALCTVFVHACDALLAIRFVGANSHTTGADGPIASTSRQGVRPHLEFDGNCAKFRQLLIVVEMALHLLCMYLGVLVQAMTSMEAIGSVAAAAPSPASGAPRLALVSQHLQLLQQFAKAVGSNLLPVARDHANGAHPNVTSQPNCVNLTFAERLAASVERMLVDLQSL